MTGLLWGSDFLFIMGAGFTSVLNLMHLLLESFSTSVLLEKLAMMIQMVLKKIDS